MSRSQAPAGVLFDLDGTLLDTAPDMVAALNALRAEELLPLMPFAELRSHVSHGAARLIEVGFGCSDGPRFEQLRRRFLELYRQDLSNGTRLFDGVDGVLDWLEHRRIPWGIVTNKPGWLTEPLLADLGLDRRTACVVCGDTLPQRKPHPLPLLHAARQIRREAARCAYVGDAERDIQAGRAAGMRTCVAAFGYLGRADDPREWRADAIAERPDDLLDVLGFTGDTT